MFAGVASVIVRTVIVKGGFGPILEDSYHGGRMQLWKSLFLNLLGLWVILGAAVFCGLCIYSVYKDCDPWTAKRVSAPDQLLPYLAMDILQDFPGLLGLFVASAYSGTLSTVSSSINALAAVTVEDYIKPFFKTCSEKKMSYISKLLSLFFGVVCIATAGLASTLGGLLQATTTIVGVITGPLLGIFMLGIFFTFANSKGAITGLMVGVSLTFWITIGAFIYPPLKSNTFPLSLSTEGCNISLDMKGNWTSNTASMILTTTASTVFTTLQQAEVTERPAIADYWYSMSYMYFVPFGTLATLVAGVIISLLTGGRKQSINPQLFLTKEDWACSIFSCSWLKHVTKADSRRWTPHSAIDHDSSNTDL